VDSNHTDDRFLPESWLARTTLADIVAGTTKLGALVEGLARSVPPANMTRAAVPVYSKTLPSIVAEPRKLSTI
jgi:hypothetical protein